MDASGDCVVGSLSFGTRSSKVNLMGLFGHGILDCGSGWRAEVGGMGPVGAGQTVFEELARQVVIA